MHATALDFRRDHLRMLHEAPAISLMRDKSGGGSKDNLDSAPEAWLCQEWLGRAPVNVTYSEIIRNMVLWSYGLKESQRS